TLSGSVEGFGGPAGGSGEVQEGKVEGTAISFRVGNTRYAGTIKPDQIELQATLISLAGGRGNTQTAAADAENRPAIGPPPDGSDPSRPAFVARGGRGPQGPATVILRRLTR